MPGIEFSEIAARLSAEDFARRELPMKGNRAKCPFHNGEHYNLQFFRDGKCYCHVCHKGGDVVTLASSVWHVSQKDAAEMLNDEYMLGLDGQTPTDEQRQRRQQERDRREAEYQQEREAWAAAADELRSTETAAQGFTLRDAESEATWAAVAKLGAAQDRWAAMWAGF